MVLWLELVELWLGKRVGGWRNSVLWECVVVSRVEMLLSGNVTDSVLRCRCGIESEMLELGSAWMTELSSAAVLEIHVA